MIELLRAAAAHTPEHPAIVTAARALSYAHLVRQAESVAAELRNRGIDRFAVFEPDPATTWMLLTAASLAGAEACVYPLATTDDALAQLRVRLDHKTVITSRTLDGDGIVTPAELLDGDERWTEAPAEGTRPLLILTTGTGGNPQAAQHDWARLLRVADKIVPTPDHRWLLAYGLNQFGGLQILLHAAAARATLVAAESVQPRDGLAAMRRWGVTHASGTPTFWRFLLAELRGDAGPVPPLQQVTLGGEAVPSALIGQLAAAFPQARISQIYGATEVGRNITVRDGRAGLPLSVLDEGGDIAFKIVDDELWVRSRSAMLGYFGQDRIAADQWRATGDLVEIVGDRILFRGRRSEIINVGGVKVHPLPIEDVVSNVDGVALAHVFGRSNPMVGQIVALEVVPVAGADRDALREAIRAACAELPPAAQPRSIRFVTTMNTAGNKVARGNTHE
jgi:acyl-CoA synthetase (AMP-forming)/AMP-acid ligase II